MLNFLKKIEEREKARQAESRGQGKGLSPAGRETGPQPGVSRKILVVGKGEALDAELRDYAVNLAERLGYGLIILSVDPGPARQGGWFSPYRQYRRRKFAQQAKAAGEAFQKQVALKGISFEQVVKFGDLGKAVAEVNRQCKRIEFVITQPGINEEEVTKEMSLPVFNITGHQGERMMAKETDSRGGKLIGKTVAYGMAAAALYAAVFWNSDTVMHYCTKGAWYAALPITAVFAVSFVHGAFAHHLWEALGIQAPKRVQPRPTAAKRPVARKRVRPQLRIDT